MSKTKKPTANIIWFEIPVDKPDRAHAFYNKLFGWKISRFPNVQDYWHIDTGGPDASPDGGMLPRMFPAHTVTNYVNVPSVTRYMEKVKKLGGKICKPKTAVPELGYFAICEDTENNQFALWEINRKAK
jgi:predicted enzyme related to lactoylglutathione lyase